jgi:DNA adenine methylase
MKAVNGGRNNNSYQMISSPFKWIGGKSRLRKEIIGILPEHTCYVEPFAGAAWVLFAKPPSDVEIINDIDQELTTFFRVVKERPEELIHSFDLELVSRAEFTRLANVDTSKLNEIQRAHRFYYLIMAGWGGELNYPRFQTSTTDGGHGNRLIGALKTLRQRLEPIHNRLRTVIIENLSWEQCIDRYDRENCVMYVDPPYPGNGCNYFHNMRDWDDHERLAQRLKRSKCRWIVSSYDKEEIRTLFAGTFISVVRSASGMSIKKHDNTRVLNKEILISNFDPFKTPNHHKTHLIKDRTARKAARGERTLFETARQ